MDIFDLAQDTFQLAKMNELLISFKEHLKFTIFRSAIKIKS